MNNIKKYISTAVFLIVGGVLSQNCIAKIPAKGKTQSSYTSEASKNTTTWQVGKTLSEQGVKKAGTDSFFKVLEISDAVFACMQKGGSYPKNCTIKRSDLRYLQLLHYNYKGQIVCGEMVCNKAIANDVKDIFMELFQAKYQIERMLLIDDFNANDENSMRANNTSSFCYRTVAGSKTLSLHARGMAIDINPLHNPMVKRNASGQITKIQPDTEVARKYATRDTKLGHIIDKNDLCYKVFIKHGFSWGGAWRSAKDYQHFEKRQ